MKEKQEKSPFTIRITALAQKVIKPDCSGKEILVRRSPQTQDVNWTYIRRSIYVLVYGVVVFAKIDPKHF